METSHGMSFHLVWNLTVVRPTNIPMRRVCFFFLFSLPLLHNDEDQSKHYLYVDCTADTALLRHGAKSTVALQISYCAHAHTRRTCT